MVTVPTCKEQILKLVNRDVYTIIRGYLAEKQWQFQGNPNKVFVSDGHLWVLPDVGVWHFAKMSKRSISLLAYSLAKLLGWVLKHEILREMYFCTDVHENNSVLLKDAIDNFEVYMTELEIRGIADCRIINFE